MPVQLDATRLLRQFLDVSLHLVQDLDPMHVLTVLVERSMELTGARYGAVATVTSDGIVDDFIHRGLTHEQVALLPHLPQGRGLLGLVIRESTAVRIDDLSSHPASVGFPTRHVPMGPFLGVPMKHRDTLFGGLYLTKAPHETPFTEQDESLITALAGIAGVTLQNSRLFGAETARAERGDLLQEIASEVRNSLDVAEILSATCGTLGRAAGVERCYIRSVAADGSTLGPVEYAWNAKGVEERDVLGGLRHPIAILAAEARTTRWSPDLSFDHRRDDSDQAGDFAGAEISGTLAALAAPLEWGDEFMGVVTLESSIPRAWTPADIALVEAAAREVSAALHQARLYGRALETAARLEEVDRQRSDFVSMVSHELRSPMTVVGGIAHLLRWKGDKLQEHQRDEILETLERESHRLTRLVSELLDFEAIERGTINLRTSKVDLVDLAGETMVDSGQVARTDVEVSPGVAEVVADRDRIKQVMLNLINNAAKFSDSATRMQILIRPSKSNVEIAVTDRGPGIPPGEVDRLFERFTRLSTTVGIAEGSGVGLYVARVIVEMHGGRIWAANEPEGGARFSFTLPRTPPWMLES